VPDITPTKIEVYLFRRRGRRVEFLCLKRSGKGRLPGVWQPVTGGLKRGEPVFAGAAREVREEIGVTPRRWWTLEDVDIYLHPETGRARVMAMFAAELRASDRIRLSREHSAFEFRPAPGARRRYLWEGQRRGLESVRRQVLRGGSLAAALEITKTMKRYQR
jgi:8-oxo-dGTP pyrophosphatase MutT (NUDIX family)